MTFHQVENVLRCHYCGREMPPPKTCPKCGSRYIKYFGAGTQKVAEEVMKRFAGARVVRVDVDTTREKDAHEKLLERFRSGEANVLVGTQMIAKGLDFPNVTLAGVVAADMSLNLPDYRSRERTFQLITQVAGRAGRAEHPGRVVVQTYEPDHYVIQLAAKQDYRAFYLRESAYRRKALYPPFTAIARIVFSAKAAAQAQAAAEAAEAALGEFLDREGMRPDVVQMRAVEAPIKLLRGLARWQVFLKMYFKGISTGEPRDAIAGRPRARGRAGRVRDQPLQSVLTKKEREEMAIRKIMVLGEDDVLRKRSRRVDKFDKRLRTLLDDMADTMYKADGVGLAAPQVGVLKRAVVIDVGEGLIELVNPEIIASEGAVVGPEGCLSVPERRGTVERPERVTVKAQNRDGREVQIEATELLAVALCHEIDHLDGVLYVDKMIEDITDQDEDEEGE